MAEATCQGCGTRLPARAYRGNPRKWCSRSCCERTKRPARKARGTDYYPHCSIYTAVCEVCGVLFCRAGKPTRPAATCSPPCRKTRTARLEREKYAADPDRGRQRMQAVRDSRDADALAVVREYQKVYRQRVGYTESTQAADQRRRATKRGATVEKFTAREVYVRDGWVCGICSDAIAPALVYPEPLSASLDHVVPLSKGGEHSRANTRASHLSCNVRRGDREVA